MIDPQLLRSFVASAQLIRRSLEARRQQMQARRDVPPLTQPARAELLQVHHETKQLVLMGEEMQRRIRQTVEKLERAKNLVDTQARNLGDQLAPAIALNDELRALLELP